MNPKVLRLVELVEEGYELQGVRPSKDGSLTLRLTQGRAAQELDFAFYEVPAVKQATQVVGQGG